MQCPPPSPESGPSSRLLQRRAPAPQGREPAHPKSLPTHKFSGLFSRSRVSALPCTLDPELCRPKLGVAPSEFEIASWALWTAKHFPNSLCPSGAASLRLPGAPRNFPRDSMRTRPGTVWDRVLLQSWLQRRSGDLPAAVLTTPPPGRGLASGPPPCVGSW